MRPESKQLAESSDLPWFVAHVRPRCEKRLVEYCEREGIPVSLPLLSRIRQYRRKTVHIEKPLFPGYVFLRVDPEQKPLVYKSDYVANLLTVLDQDTFHGQLQSIFTALQTNYEVVLAPEIKVGTRVKIRTGPLRGLEGYVEERTGKVNVFLRLDFIQQAAAVKVDASELELS